MKTIESAALTLRQKLSSRETSISNLPHIPADAVQVEDYLTTLLRRTVSDGFVDTSHVEAVADWLTAEDATPWLLLTGNPGTGKTTMLKLIAWMFRANYVEFKKFPASDLPTIFLDNGELAVAQIMGGSWCRYLLLDDVGTEPVVVKSFGNEIYPFVRVVEARYDRRLPLVITSNLAPGDFLDHYGIRTFDRMRELCTVVAFGGESFRARNK